MKRNCLLRNNDLDERQLLLRGNVYQHVVVALMALLLVNGFLKDEGVTWARGMWENILIFWAGAFIGMAEFILRDILPAGGRRNSLYGLFGIFGGIMLVLGAVHAVGQHRALVESGALTDLGAEMIQAVLMLVLFVMFLCKQIYDKHNAGSEE